MKKKKNSIEINERLLSEVRAFLGTSSIRETVERALQEVLLLKARREEVDALCTMSGMDLDDPRTMARAWRV